MKKVLRTLLALWICLSIWTPAFSETATFTQDYSVAAKLFKQLEFGSGFSGTLTFSLTAQEGREKEAITTINPFLFNLTYISVPEDKLNGIRGERRFDAAFMDGDQPRALVSLALTDEGTCLKSNLLGNTGWYILPSSPFGRSAIEGESEPTYALLQNSITATMEGLIDESATQSLLSFILPALLNAQSRNTGDLADALNAYITKMDLWLEAYRQNTVFDKQDDGITTMEAHYTISPEAIKEQLKKMVSDILADTVLLAKLQALLSDEQAQLMLNPQMESLYFYAIDSLPLPGELTISRTLSLKGDTLALYLELPFYDQAAGETTLSYDRKAATEQNLPKTTLSLESNRVTLQIEYEEDQTEKDTMVYQGIIRREPKGMQSSATGEENAAASSKIFSAAFTLQHTQISEIDSEKNETLSHDYEFHLEPHLAITDATGQSSSLPDGAESAYYQFPAFDLTANLLFKSQPESNKPTYVDMALKLTGEDLAQTLDLTFSGKSTTKWTPEAIDAKSAQRLSDLTESELTALLAETGVKTGICFLPFMTLPKPANTGSPTDDVESTPSADQPAAP